MSPDYKPAVSNKSVSILSLKDLDSICTRVSYLYEANEVVCQNSRSAEDIDLMSESTSNMIKEATMPLLESGISYRDAVINMNYSVLEKQAYQDYVLTDEELLQLNTLSDEELILLGAELCILSDLCSAWDKETIDNINELEISSNKHLDCFLKVTGIATVAGALDIIKTVLKGGCPGEDIFNIKSLINAKTGLQVLRAMGVKYLGVFGVGIMLIEYIDCVKS